MRSLIRGVFNFVKFYHVWRWWIAVVVVVVVVVVEVVEVVVEVVVAAAKAGRDGFMLARRGMASCRCSDHSTERFATGP